jgi:hypothetical protein
MGKAAENERIKLRATFYNNLAIGLILAGFFLPLLSIYSMESFQPFVDWSKGGPPPMRQVGHFLVACIGTGVAVVFARMNHNAAKRIISTVETFNSVRKLPDRGHRRRGIGNGSE